MSDPIYSLLKFFRLQSCALGDAEAAEADFLVRPSFEPASPTSFAQRDEAIMAGYLAMKAVLPGLQERLAGQAAAGQAGSR